LRIQHHEFVRRLDRLIGDSFEYIDTVKRIPYFDKELIQSELSVEISDQRADVTRFPYTVWFLSDLQEWMGEGRVEVRPKERARQDEMFDPTDTTRFPYTIRF
jgi:hypothetical protein